MRDESQPRIDLTEHMGDTQRVVAGGKPRIDLNELAHALERRAFSASSSFACSHGDGDGDGDGDGEDAEEQAEEVAAAGSVAPESSEE